MARAVHALGGLPGARVRAVSRLYATEPVGFTDQPEFRNAVVRLDVTAGADGAALVDTTAGALSLLASLKALERAFGRVARERWGPRELDLDLLIYGRALLSVDPPPAARSNDAAIDPVKATKLLVVPHPAAATRLFVLAPMADLAPRLVPPGWDVTVETARRRQLAIEGPDAVRPIGTWDPSLGGWRPDQPR